MRRWIVALAVAAAAAAALAHAATREAYRYTNSLPVWSPDGRFLAYFEGNSRVLLRPPGGARKRLGLESFRWTPDGSHLVFLRHESLFAATADGTGARKIASEAGYSFDVSPDSRTLVYGHAQLYTVGVDGSATRRLTEPVPSPCSYCSAPGDHEPAWSPDGRHVAFLRSFSTDGLHGVSTLMRLDLADGSVRKLLDEPLGNDSYPHWSADSRWVAFFEDYGDYGDLYVVATTGGIPTRLGRYSEDHWAPIGDRLAFQRGDSVLVVRPTGGTSARIAHARFVTWLPDGRSLVARRGRFLDVFAPTGAFLRRLGPGVELAAARDGRLAITLECGSKQGLWTARADGTLVDRLTRHCNVNGSGRIDGGAYDDVITGSLSTDVIHGRGGADRIDGKDGPDRLFGDAGDDVLVAPDKWRDQVSCGAGQDVAVVDAADDVAKDCEVVRR